MDIVKSGLLSFHEWITQIVPSEHVSDADIRNIRRMYRDVIVPETGRVRRYGDLYRGALFDFGMHSGCAEFARKMIDGADVCTSRVGGESWTTDRSVAVRFANAHFTSSKWFGAVMRVDGIRDGADPAVVLDTRLLFEWAVNPDSSGHRYLDGVEDTDKRLGELKSIIRKQAPYGSIKYQILAEDEVVIRPRKCGLRNMRFLFMPSFPEKGHAYGYIGCGRDVDAMLETFRNEGWKVDIPEPVDVTKREIISIDIRHEKRALRVALE